MRSERCHRLRGKKTESALGLETGALALDMLNGFRSLKFFLGPVHI